MKKRLLILLAVCLLLSGCTVMKGPLGAPSATNVPGTAPILPEAAAPQSLDRLETATLFFRYMEEPYLASENRAITHSPARPYELSLLTELISGPGTHAADLTALFPAGTQVLSTVTQGRTLFVTLSQEIMDRYPDEESLSAREAQLRRQLCMQSIVATITENCDVDQVQILVEQQGNTTGSLRLQERYFLLDPASTDLVGPMTREDSLILTPRLTAETVLSLWQSRDWQRLYQYIARRNPVTGAERVSYRDFVTAMENLPVVSAWELTGGSVTQDGAQATFSLAATILRQGQEETREGCILRLCREESIWRVTLGKLTGWLEEP